MQRDINEKYLCYINDYLIVVGMPEVVANYVDNRNYQEASDIQEKIIKSYDQSNKFQLFHQYGL